MRGDDRKRGASAQQLDEVARSIGRLMDQHDDRRSEALRQRAEHTRDGVETTGRGDERDHRHAVARRRAGRRFHGPTVSTRGVGEPPFVRKAQPPPTPSVTVPVPPHVGHSLPPERPVAAQSGH
jgi:hypothetical protein